MVDDGSKVQPDVNIASYVSNTDAFLSFLEQKRVESQDAVKFAAVEELMVEQTTLPDRIALMRQIKKLIQEKSIDDNTGTLSHLSVALINF